MNILVTGCGGFIGSHVCERLLWDGHDVVGLQHASTGARAARVEANLLAIQRMAVATGRAFVLVRGSITDPHVLDSCEDVGGAFEAVIHLAARAGVRESLGLPLAYTETNVLGLQNLLLGLPPTVRAFVFASSSSVYGKRFGPAQEDMPTQRPLSPYAMTKIAGELCLAQHHTMTGLSVAMLRFFSVYGPRQRPDLVLTRFTERLLAGQSLTVFGDGTSHRDYTYVSDIVDGIVLAMDAHLGPQKGMCEAYNIGSGKPVSLDELLATLSSALSSVSTGDVVSPEPVVRYMPAHVCDPPQTHACLAKATDVLGYAPRVSFTDGVQAFVNWYLCRQQEGKW